MALAKMDSANKTLRSTATSRPVYMIFRNYNLNLAFDARHRS